MRLNARPEPLYSVFDLSTIGSHAAALQVKNNNDGCGTSSLRHTGSFQFDVLPGVVTPYERPRETVLHCAQARQGRLLDPCPLPRFPTKCLSLMEYHITCPHKQQPFFQSQHNFRDIVSVPSISFPNPESPEPAV